MKKVSISHRLGLVLQHGRHFIVWKTNMAGLTTSETSLYSSFSVPL